MSEEETKVGLRQSVDDLNKKMDTLLKIKPKKDGTFKIPWGIRSKIKSQLKKKKIAVIYLQNNKNGDIKWGEQVGDQVKVDNKIFDMSEGTVWLFRGKYPMIVQPEWSMRPIGIREYEEAKANHSTTDEEELLIKAIERKEIGTPLGGLNWKMILLILAGAAAVIFIVFKLQGQGGEGGTTGGNLLG
jgi:hypothetical protein